MIDKKQSAVMIHLLKGPIYSDINNQLWEELIYKKSSITDYMSQIGLHLHIDEEDGYAFLRQKGNQEEGAEETQLPRLISRRSLPFLPSVLCVLLRKKVIEHESQDGSPKLIIKGEEIHSMLQIYVKNEKNEKQVRGNIDSAIEKVKSLGILRNLRAEDDLFEVKKVIKSLIGPEWLKDLNSILTKYRETKPTKDIENDESSDESWRESPK